MTLRIRTNLPIQLRADGRREVLFDTSSPGAATASSSTMFKALGYRQTKAPASKGGTANHNGFRVRNGGMRALGRSFRTKPFISGHIKGDARARGGTIRDSYTEELEASAELAIIYEIEAQAPWAIEGLANGTIDRFSFSILPSGEITCTVHDVPVWSIDECFCWPGEPVMVGGASVVAEWEFEDADGVELSAVNVPAVEGTGVISAVAASVLLADDPRAFMRARLAQASELAELCGRNHPAIARLAAGGDPVGGFAARRPQTTMAAQHDRSQPMDRAVICQQLGLPVTATDDEIRQRIAALGTDAAQTGVLRAQLEQSATEREAERNAAHVEAGISTLRASHQVTDQVVAGLRAAAQPPGGRAAFDAALELVRGSAPLLAAPGAPAAAGGVRTPLQSDARPAAAPADASLEDGPDAFEANRSNPNLGKLMKWAGVTVDHVRQHGSRQFTVVPNLRELADATAGRP